MYNAFFYIIVSFVFVEFIVNRWLSSLNRKSSTDNIPPVLQGLYDERKYKLQQEYFRTNNRFGQYSETLGTVVVLVMLFLGAFGWLFNIFSTLEWNIIWVTLSFFGILFFANDLLMLPFSVYDTFVIEEKFGFNKTTKRTFILDKLKSWLFGCVVGGILLAGLTGLYIWLKQDFWICAFLMVGIFSLLLNMFYSEWIVPLFNKQTPLEAGELRSAIENFGETAGFKIDNIYVIDGSRRSTKANAYFSGLGKKKRIVLFDTLIEKLSVDEIVAVLAHEIGHYKHKHTRQMLILSLLNLFLLFFLFSLMVDSRLLAQAMGSDTPSFALALIAFSLLYTPLGMLVGIILNLISRRNEYQADAFAASYGKANDLINGLKKISVESLTNLTPNKWYVFVYYSHPTLLQRIEALTKSEKL